MGFKHRQALVMVHGYHRVRMLQGSSGKSGIRRDRPRQVQALGFQFFDDRGDHLILLLTQQAVLPGVGVDAADQQARLNDAEFRLHVIGNDPDDVAQVAAGDAPRNLVQGHVRRDQRNPGKIVRQHHHRRQAAAVIRDVLGMAREIVPRRGNGGLAHRTGDHGMKFTGHAAVYRAFNGRDQAVGIARHRFSGLHRRHRQRLVQV